MQETVGAWPLYQLGRNISQRFIADNAVAANMSADKEQETSAQSCQTYVLRKSVAIIKFALQRAQTTFIFQQ